MDGLLIDSEPLWVLALDAFCSARGVSYSAADASACMGRGIPHSATYLAARHGWPEDRDAHVDEINRRFIALVGQAPSRTGADDLLRSLHGRMPLGLGSSSARLVIDAALAGKGWLPLFDAIVTGSDVERLKPAPDIFLEAARRLGQRPDTCVVFEDSLAGCQAARAAGMLVVAVPDHEADRGAFLDVADVVAVDLIVGARAVGLALALEP
jgi:HAD superfamily hydrolase (TIGR01509 family)